MTFSGSKLKLALAVGALLILLFSYHYYSNWRAQRQFAEAAQEAKELPHRQILAQLEDLRLHGTSLPPCPLIFPLLDSKGRVTPLGSYLSYFGMKQASYLPQSVLSLPNLDQTFRDFDLFNSHRSAADVYKTQLPFRFQTKDFGEGTWKKTFTGWKIHLRFWGTEPEKTYDHLFAKGDLHNAPSWIAQSLQDYLGFKPSADQAAFLSQPIFPQDADLLRTANLQIYFNHGGERLVTHWQDILIQNPNQPDLAGVWMTIQDERENRFHPEIMKAILAKQPLSSFASKELAEEYFEAGRYADALPLFFSLLKSDDDNSSLYAWTVSCLEGLEEWDVAVQLTRHWTQKYPENPEAWMALAVHLRNESQKATDPAACASLIAEGYAAAQKACDLSPQDARTRINLIGVEGEAHEPQTILEASFQKAVSLDPTSDKPYQAYLSTLNATGLVDAQAAWDFVKQNAPEHPTLLIDQADQSLRASTPSQTLDNLKNSGEEADLEKAYRTRLTIHPADLALWKDYFSWTDLTGATAQALDFAKTLAAGHEELKALAPTLTLMVYDKPGADAKAVSQISGAYQSLLALDDQDWNRWNAYAKFCVENHLDEEAKKAITAIGDNWDESVWPQADLDKARVDLGLDPIPAPPGGLSVVSPTASTFLTPVSPSASAIPKANP
jgi:hypothetical protein